MVICQRCWKYTRDRAELSLYEGQWLCQPCIRAGKVVGGHKRKGDASRRVLVVKPVKIVTTNGRPAPQPLPIAPIGERRALAVVSHSAHPTGLSAPRWPLLPARCSVPEIDWDTTPTWKIFACHGGWREKKRIKKKNGKVYDCEVARWRDYSKFNASGKPVKRMRHLRML